MKDQEFDTARKWLADAPLYIDADQVERFFDAVVRPDAEVKEWTYELNDSATKTLVGKINAELGGKTGALAKLWAELSAKLGLSVEFTTPSTRRNVS